MANPRISICALAQLLLACGIAYAWPICSSIPAQKGEAANVIVGSVAEVRAAQSETFIGTIQPLRKSTIGSAVEGRVIEIQVQPGDSVQKNDVLSRLRTGTLDIEIDSAKLQLSLAEQQLLELNASLPKDLELAKARVRESSARLSFAKTEYDRGRKLRNNGNAISQGELDLARSQFIAAEEAATLQRIEAERLEVTRDTKLKQAQLSVELAKQEVRRLEDRKEKYTVRAPYQSVVTSKLTDVGEWVTQGQAVVEVLQLDPVELIVNVPQEQLPVLQSSLTVSTEANPLTAQIEVEGIDEQLQGVVQKIVTQADLRSRTFPVRIEIQNLKVGNDYLLKPGMIGRATVQVGTASEMLMVKKDALVLGAGKKSVFTIGDREGAEIAIEVPVKIGASQGDWIQVMGNLSQGDKIVLMGNERLRSGDEVKIASVNEELPATSSTTNSK